MYAAAGHTVGRCWHVLQRALVLLLAGHGVGTRDESGAGGVLVTLSLQTAFYLAC